MRTAQFAKMFRHATVAIVFLLMIAFTCSAVAQLSGKGEIKGTLTDPTGALVPHATVTAVNDNTGATITRTSSNSGDFDLTGLDPGTYTVTVTLAGFATTTQKGVRINALEVQDLPLTLTVGSADQSVTVTNAPPVIETSNATLGATMAQEMYAALPIQMGAVGAPDQRRATDFAALMPGVQTNTTNGNQTTNTGVVNGVGSRGAVSDVYIDGLPFVSAAGQGDPRFVWTAISVDAVDQFQVQTAGYSAMYEGEGVQNYQIKSGGNKIHGAIYEYFRNTALDTWGFFAPGVINPQTETVPGNTATGHATKPAEHQNEYGINLSLPFWRDKIFFFGNYSGFRYSKGPTYAAQTIPTAAEQAGDFSGMVSAYSLAGIYNPLSCPNGTTGNCQRPQFNDGGLNHINLASNAAVSPVGLAINNFVKQLPLANANTANNYVGGYKTGLNNYTTTEKVDWIINQKHSFSVMVAVGRQATTAPATQTQSSSNATTTFNQAPAPFIDVQEYAPKTHLAIVEDNYTFTPNIVNQFKYGFARYYGPSFSLTRGGSFAATALGITGLPIGQASDGFPNVRFSGSGSPNYFAGYTANIQATNAYTLVDNLQWNIGRHAITFGAQLGWMQYNYTPQTTGTTPLQVTFAPAQTACYGTSTSTSTCYVGTGTISSNVDTSAGLPYASLLIGAANAGSFTNSTVVETGARFRPISPYIQDDWKINTKLTVNIGLRWDYYPSYREVHDRLTWFSPNTLNPVTGVNAINGLSGALQVAGNNTGGIGGHSNVSNYMKNFGPRLGFAYAPTPQTVIRGSYAVVYAHGNAVGGSATSRQGTGLLGASASASFSATANMPAFYMDGTRNANGFSIPTYNLPQAFPAFNSAFGTGYTTTSPYNGNPQAVSYSDPYLGGRAPEFENWTFGLQQSLGQNTSLTITYVGAEGHFLQPDSQTARGLYVNQLSPQYLALGTNLGTKVNALSTGYLASKGLTLPYANFDQTQTLAQMLKPFPQYNSMTDAYGMVGNSSFHALEISVVRRPSNDLTYMINYIWSKAIDDLGTYRSGYAIPQSALPAGTPVTKVNRIDRSESLASQPQHLVFTGVYNLPFGKGRLGGGNRISRSLLSGYTFSEILTAYTGSPLAITGASSACGTNQAQGTCMPTLNPNFSGPARINGAWGHGVTATNFAVNFIAPSGNASGIVSSSTPTVNGPFLYTTAYTFGNAPRTAAYSIRGPGNYNLDISLRRRFGLPVWNSSHLILEADMYNVTNHTLFGGIGTTLNSSGFGQVSTQSNLWRDIQLSGRIEF